MMLEIKFKYYLKDLTNTTEEHAAITTKIITLDQLQNDTLHDIISRDYERYFVVGREECLNRPDVNGRELYSGDIVCIRSSFFHNHMFVAVKNNDICSFEYKSLTYNHHTGYTMFGPSIKTLSKYVGNTYQNPELLEEKPD